MKHWKLLIICLVVALVGVSYVVVTDRRLYANGQSCAPYSTQHLKQQLRQARLRWAHNGSGNYTVVVAWGSGVNGYAIVSGDVELTVDSLELVDIETLTRFGGFKYDDSLTKDNYDFYNGMTVEERFERAAYYIEYSLYPPCYSTLEIEYDPTYGYITFLRTDTHGRLNPFGYFHPHYGQAVSGNYRSFYAKQLELQPDSEASR